MKKLKPSKEVLLQYLYDYGIKDTCKLLHITEEEFNSILEPSKENIAIINTITRFQRSNLQ